MPEVYLDYAAATPLDPEVKAAMDPFWSECFYNPSSPYLPARSVRDRFEAARSTLAHLIGARADCITLTAGATEANNLAFACVSKEAEVLVDALEHDSVLACAKAAHPQIVGVLPDGRIDPQDIQKALTPQTELVSIELANGEIGTIQPIRAISEIISQEKQRRLKAGEKRPLYFHTDASQAAGALSLAVSSLGCDLMTLSAAKIYGPKQVGLLWSADNVVLHPLVRGGGQEGGVRSGTENVAGTVGFACALELAVKRRTNLNKKLRLLRASFAKSLTSEFPWSIISGPRQDKLHLPGLLHISFPFLDARRLVIMLERRGVYAGTGSACAASRMHISHVLQALGMPSEIAQGSLRFSLGLHTEKDDIDYAAKQLIEVVRSEVRRLNLSTDELYVLSRKWAPYG